MAWRALSTSVRVCTVGTSADLDRRQIVKYVALWPHRLDRYVGHPGLWLLRRDRPLDPT